MYKKAQTHIFNSHKRIDILSTYHYINVGLMAPPGSWAIINQERQCQALVAKEADLFLLDHGGQYQEMVKISGNNVLK